MALPASINEEAFQGFPEPIQKEYTKQPTGEYRLDVTPVGGLKLENVDKLTGTLNKVKKANKGLEGTLSQYGTVKVTPESEVEFEATFTPEQYQTTVSELESTRKTLEETDPKKRVEEARHAAIQETTNALTQKHQAEVKTLTQASEQATAELRQTRLAFSVSEALIKSGAEAIDLLRPVLERQTGFDENNKPFIKDENGEMEYSTVTGDPMTHLEYANKLKEIDQYKRCWPAEDASGTGGTLGDPGTHKPGGPPAMPPGMTAC